MSRDMLKSPLLYVYAIMPCEKNIMVMDSGNHHIYFQYQKKSTRSSSIAKFNILRADNNTVIGSFPAQIWFKKITGDGDQMKLNYYSNKKSNWCDLTIQPCNKEIYKSSCPQKDKDYSGKWSEFIKAWFSGKSGIQSDGTPTLPSPPGANIKGLTQLTLATVAKTYEPTKEEEAAEDLVTAAEQKYGKGSGVDPDKVTTLLAESLPKVPQGPPKGGKRKTKKSKKSRRKTKKARRKTKKSKRKLKRSKRKH
jgi:hypothetical protein